jgi:hypothetical protein
MEFENRYATNGKGNLGVTLGAIGTGLGVLSGGLNGLTGLMGGNAACRCEGDHYVNRYEATQAARIAELETRNKLLESNIYTDQKIADVYERLNVKIAGIESQICQQSVINAQVTANLACLQNTVAGLSALTKTVIPIDHVCPAPMPQYNSWVAPTATT